MLDFQKQEEKSKPKQKGALALGKGNRYLGRYNDYVGTLS